MTTAAIARLKVTLDDVEPKVVRWIEVPIDIKLDRLHLTLQAALGWTNSHLYEIRARDVRWGLPDSDWPDGRLDAGKARLVDALGDGGTKTLRSLYDFGDGWEHTIKFERVMAPEPDVAYPRLIESDLLSPLYVDSGRWRGNKGLGVTGAGRAGWRSGRTKKSGRGNCASLGPHFQIGRSTRVGDVLEVARPI